MFFWHSDSILLLVHWSSQLERNTRVSGRYLRILGLPGAEIQALRPYCPQYKGYLGEMGRHSSRVWNRYGKYSNRWTELKHCSHPHFGNWGAGNSTTCEYPWIRKFQRGDVPFCEMESRRWFEREARGSRGEWRICVSLKSLTSFDCSEIPLFSSRS